MNKETGILTIASYQSNFAAFNNEGTRVSFFGGISAWADDFVSACAKSGYDVVGNWEFQDTDISIGEKLPNWDTYVEV